MQTLPQNGSQISIQETGDGDWLQVDTRESFYGDRDILKQATELGKYAKNTGLYIHLKWWI